MDWRTKDPVAFHRVKPDVRTTIVLGSKAARGNSYQVASDRAHFYVWAHKVGGCLTYGWRRVCGCCAASHARAAPRRHPHISIHIGSQVGTCRVATNYMPWADYKLFGKWPEDLWWQGKLAHDTYFQYSVKCRKGHDMRMRDFHAVCRDEGEARTDAEIRKRKAELATLLHPFRQIAAVEEWAEQYLVVSPRCKMLLLHADSRAGKTSFAESLFNCPFVVTVEDNQFLDLKGFDRSRHDGIVLDNVNSFGQLLRWRAVLQARNVKTKGAQSQTQLYSSL